MSSELEQEGEDEDEDETGIKLVQSGRISRILGLNRIGRHRSNLDRRDYNKERMSREAK